MKKISILLSFLIITISCKGNENKTDDSLSVANSNKQEEMLKRYDVKSGIVSYQTTISGKVMGSTVKGSGASSLYFKNWGGLELREEESNQITTVSIMGHTNTEKTHSHVMNKLDNGESYLADFEKKQITVRRDPMMDIINQSGSNASDVGKKMLESMGGKMIGQEKFMGYNCEIWEIMGGKQWVYKGVMLKIDMSVMGIRTVTEAISAKFDVSVADKYFELPDFPVSKDQDFLNNQDFQAEMQQDMVGLDESMDQISKLSFKEWKKMVMKDPEMKAMSDEELRKSYDMMQQMIKARNSN